MLKPKKAFTLIELLVVIAIIGILATISVLALNNARAKSRDAKRIADVKQMQTALELYFNDMNRYPLTSEFTGSISSTSTYGTTTYMANIPTAPTPSDGSCSNSDNSFAYTSADGSSYTLSFCVGGNTGSVEAGINTASPSGIVYGGEGSATCSGGATCSCTDANLPCCDQCNTVTAVCLGGTYCARNQNCALGGMGNFCYGGTCVTQSFLPSMLPNLQVWLDASDQASLFTDPTCTAQVTGSGDTIGCWKDKSANNYRMVQNTAGERPTYTASAVNGNPILAFGGTQYMFSSVNIIMNQPNTTFVVFSNQNWGNHRPIVGNTALSNCISQQGTANQIKMGASGGSGSNFESYQLMPTQTTIGQYNLAEAIFNTPNFTFMVNGVSQTTSSNYNAVNGSGAFFIAYDFYYGHAQVNVAEVVVYNSVLSVNERQQVEDYLNNKYSIY